jgi:hypothetical protein
VTSDLERLLAPDTPLDEALRLFAQLRTTPTEARAIEAVLARAGAPPPSFLLTDLQPHPAAWSRLRESRPGVVDFVAEPVDATRIPADLARGRARVIVNALHHFEPDVAGAMLRGTPAGAARRGTQRARRSLCRAVR